MRIIPATWKMGVSILAIGIVQVAATAAFAQGGGATKLARPAPLPGVPDLFQTPELSFEARAQHLHTLGVAIYVNSLGKTAEREKAILLLEQAVACDPANDVYRIDLADAYVLTGDETAIGMAIDLYEDVLDSDPDNDSALARLADAYLELCNDDAAFAVLARRAVGKNADSTATAMQLALTALRTGDFVRGAEEAVKLARLYPDDPIARLGAAMLLADAGRSADALEQVDCVLKTQSAESPMAEAARDLKERIGR